MKVKTGVTVRVEELCTITSVSVETIVAYVEHGIVEPQGAAPEQWRFDEPTITLVMKAARLQRDFDIDAAGVSLALELMDRLEQLRTENRMLRQRLARFLSD